MEVSKDISQQERVPSAKADPNLVQFAPQDPANPRNWSAGKKRFLVCLCCSLNVLLGASISAVPSAGEQIGETFDIGDELVTLGLSLFVLGIAIGPVVGGPLSEWAGRRPVYLYSWFLFALFQLPLAVVKTTSGFLICRLLQGLFAGPPLAMVGGTVHDLYSRDFSGPGIALYAWASTVGPDFGNMMTGFIGQEKGWRWSFWVLLIVYMVWFIFLYVFLPETRDTQILKKRAKRLRSETGNENLRGPHEDDLQIKHLFSVSLLRPWKFLATEPITMFASAYNGLCFGILFMFNEGFSFVFARPPPVGKGWTHPGVVSMTQASVMLGLTIGLLTTPWAEREYAKRVKANNGLSSPEARAIPSLYLTWCLPIGLFIFAWTSYPSITWVAPLVGTTIFGIGFFSVINTVSAYLHDAYGHYAASALGASVLVRNTAGAAFPLFSRQMFERLGNQWALSLSAFLALAICPLMFVLRFKGPALRQKSPYCREHFYDLDN